LDISVSPLGDVGAIDYNFKYYQNSPLMGGWGVVNLREIQPTKPPLNPQSMDLALDSLGRPHIVGVSMGSPYDIVAYDFDPMLGQWKTQSLGTSADSQSPFGAAVAADSLGGVGAAWVKYSQPTGAQLMYAYKDGNNNWESHVVATSSVYNPITHATEPLMSSQGVGLTYDANDFPVISFTASGKIWLAYAPVTAVPEPSTIILLAIGGALMMLLRKKIRL
jgi:hypothetical protein